MWKFKNTYHRLKWTNFIAILIAPFFNNHLCVVDEGGGTAYEQEQAEILLKKIDEKMKKSAKEGIDQALSEFDKKIEKAIGGNLSVKEFETFKNEIKEELNKFSLQEYKADVTALHQKHAELINILKEQGNKINSISEINLPKTKTSEFENLSKKDQFAWLIENALKTDSVKEWLNKDMRGATPKLDFKAVSVALGIDHTGTIFITEPVMNIRDIPRMMTHIRNYLSVRATEEINITFPEIYDYTDIYTLGTQMLAENEAITDVSFKTKENTSNVKRLGVSLNISKRYFKGKPKDLTNHVIDQIPDALMFKEDMQLLFGDGSGNNLNGIVTDARSFDLTPQTYVAGNISSIATYDGGTKTLVTFAAAKPHGLLNGDSITFANTTNYNSTYTGIIRLDEFTIVLNTAYQAESTAAWTGTGKSYWYQSVDNAQEFDVLSAAISILEAGLYRADTVFINPQTLMKISTLKDTTAQYIGVTRDAAGRLNIAGVPVIPHPQIPADWFLVGDFSPKAIEIRDYTPMSIQFLEDVTTKKENSIVVLADEEIHLVKYNPNWYIFDTFSNAKTAIETPSS